MGCWRGPISLGILCWAGHWRKWGKVSVSGTLAWSKLQKEWEREGSWLVGQDYCPGPSGAACWDCEPRPQRPGEGLSQHQVCGFIIRMGNEGKYK